MVPGTSYDSAHSSYIECVACCRGEFNRIILEDGIKLRVRRVWIPKRPSAAGHTHVAGNSGALVGAVDDEIMPLWLAQNGIINGL